MSLETNKTSDSYNSASFKTASEAREMLAAVPEKEPAAPATKIERKTVGVFARIVSFFSWGTNANTPNQSLQTRITLAAESGHPVPAPRVQEARFLQKTPIDVTFILNAAPRPRTFTKEGQEIQETVAAPSRIQLQDVPGEQFQLDIIGEPKELAPGESAFVGLSEDRVATMLVEEQGRRYLVQVKLSEISDRLLISKEVEEYTHLGLLDSLFQKKAAKLQNLPNLVADYQKLFDAHFKLHPGGVIGQYVDKKGAVLKEGLNARQMMKVVRAFHRAELSEGQMPAGRQLDFADLKNKYAIKGLRILFKREEGQLKMSRFEIAEKVGEGSFGTAFRVAQLDLNRMLVVKVLKAFSDPQKMEKAREELLQEYTLLREIHSRGKVAGIQDAPHAFIAVDKKKFGYIMVGTAYSGNSGDLIASEAYQKLDLADKLDCCTQILEGGVRLDELGILHLDQKPQNVFYRVEEAKGKKRYILDTADLGGAVKAAEASPAGLVHTASYIPRGDAKTGLNAKTAVYQRGVILFNYLANGKHPWPFTQQHFPDHSDLSKYNEQALIDQKVSEPLRTLIRIMCDPSADKRPDAATAYRSWIALTQPMTI